jgi:hypothetical protein
MESTSQTYDVLFRNAINDENICRRKDLKYVPQRGNHIFLKEVDALCGVVNHVYHPERNLHLLIVKYKKPNIKKESDSIYS